MIHCIRDQGTITTSDFFAPNFEDQHVFLVATPIGTMDPAVAKVFTMPIPSSKVGLLKVVYLSRLAEPYPPDDLFMAEKQPALQRWEKHLQESPILDPRKPERPPIILLDEAKLVYDVAEEECVLFIDKDNDEIIGLVVQNLVGDSELLTNFNGTVFAHLNTADRMNARVSQQISFSPSTQLRVM